MLIGVQRVQWSLVVVVVVVAVAAADVVVVVVHYQFGYGNVLVPDDEQHFAWAVAH